MSGKRTAWGRQPWPLVVAALLAGVCIGAGPGTSAARSAGTAQPPRVVFQSFAPTGGGDALYTMRQDGSDARPLPLTVPGNAIHPDWSPDGRRLVFIVADAKGVQSLWSADADGGNARVLRRCGTGCLSLDYPAYSPDGRSVVFTFYDSVPPPASGPPASDSIRILELASGHERIVARSRLPRLLDTARWSPDGARLVVEIDRFADDGSSESGCAVGILNVSSGRLRLLTGFAMFAFYPDWSPRGNLISFDTYDLLAFQTTDKASNLYTVRPDGTHLRKLTTFPAGGKRASAPSFTRDGRRIVFVYVTDAGASGRHGAFIDVQGGAISQIQTRYSGPVTHPRLSA